MASILGGLRHFRTIFNPPAAEKSEDALKFGILGAANIAPLALILPAKTHPDVVIYAVAARDKNRATDYALKYNIPNVMDDYQAVLDDANVDAVYIPLPNGLHLEWAMKALAQGKHVLLEKPSTSNTAEAEMLFRSPILAKQKPAAPIILEAFHYRFSPAWNCFMSHINQPRVVSVHATAVVPGRLIPHTDIRFNYSLAGGALMDIGTYCVAAVREIYGTEPQTCLESTMNSMPTPYERCDGSFKVAFRFPNNETTGVDEPVRVGLVEGSLQAPLIDFRLPRIEVLHSPVTTETLLSTNSKVLTTARRKVTFYNFMFPHFYHRIDIEDDVTVERVCTGESEDRQLISKSTVKQQKKAYTFQDMGMDAGGEEYWLTYRWMLGQFVDRIRGRNPAGPSIWYEPEESIAQMKALDMAYEKAGLGARPSGEYITKSDRD
ncbi:uncharacterized protein LY79DRAFT_641962 [Colletotrichum navitas]|uniref:D-xylose 1-dehydrogenase (NADP(+), D-xylono-1,5-lactone-forming) n=1 Tax=Colletotrichum navitas TaxID=681940 RepID=A0AAD8PN30_9PEZI|nr:uncharacterized protein LY79DRAFT_641962 [Colletotrichum navitas]KAK1573002.1 hypothetical protein LY79DRAFT_641962 [Colletotrichum navitas]